MFNFPNLFSPLASSNLPPAPQICTHFVHSNGRVEILTPKVGQTEAETVNKLNDDFKCSVCFDVYERPLRTRKCRHQICAPCFTRIATPEPGQRYFSQNLQVKCPSCRVSLGNSSTTAADALEDVPGAHDEVMNIYARCKAVLPSPEPITLTAAAKQFWSAVKIAVSIPTRACNTALNLGLFAGYYVTVMVGTALGTFTGATVGFANAVKNEIPSLKSQQPTKSIREYTVSYAQSTFNLLARPYNTLGTDSHSFVLPALTCFGVMCLEVWAASKKRPEPLLIEAAMGRHSTNLYVALFKLMYKVSVPYAPITERTVSLFRRTENYIQSF